MTMILGKAVLTTSALARETVPVPEWGGDIILRELSARELSDVAARKKAIKDDAPNALLDFLSHYIGYAWINEDGTHVLAADEVDSLLDQPLNVLTTLVEVAGRLSGDLPGAAEEAKKNSTTTPSAESGSDSPSPSAAAQ